MSVAPVIAVTTAINKEGGEGGRRKFPPITSDTLATEMAPVGLSLSTRQDKLVAQARL